MPAEPMPNKAELRRWKLDILAEERRTGRRHLAARRRFNQQLRAGGPARPLLTEQIDIKFVGFGAWLNAYLWDILGGKISTLRRIANTLLSGRSEPVHRIFKETLFVILTLLLVLFGKDPPQVHPSMSPELKTFLKSTNENQPRIASVNEPGTDIVVHLNSIDENTYTFTIVQCKYVNGGWPMYQFHRKPLENSYIQLCDSQIQDEDVILWDNWYSKQTKDTPYKYTIMRRITQQHQMMFKGIQTSEVWDIMNQWTVTYHDTTSPKNDQNGPLVESTYCPLVENTYYIPTLQEDNSISFQQTQFQGDSSSHNTTDVLQVIQEGLTCIQHINRQTCVMPNLFQLSKELCEGLDQAPIVEEKTCTKANAGHLCHRSISSNGSISTFRFSLPRGGNHCIFEKWPHGSSYIQGVCKKNTKESNKGHKIPDQTHTDKTLVAHIKKNHLVASSVRIMDDIFNTELPNMDLIIKAALKFKSAYQQQIISLSHMLSPFVSPRCPLSSYLPWKRPPLLIQLYCRKYCQDFLPKKDTWTGAMTSAALVFLNAIPQPVTELATSSILSALTKWVPNFPAIRNLKLTDITQSIDTNQLRTLCVDNLEIKSSQPTTKIDHADLDPGKQYLVKKSDGQPLAVVRLSGKPEPKGGGYTYKWKRKYPTIEIEQTFLILEILYVAGDVREFLETFNCHILQSKDNSLIYENTKQPSDSIFPSHRQELIDIDVYAHETSLTDHSFLLGSFVSAVNNEVHLCTEIHTTTTASTVQVNSAITFYEVDDAEVSKLDEKYQDLFTKLLSIRLPSVVDDQSGKTHTVFTLLSGYTKSFGIELVNKSAPAPTGGGGAISLSSSAAGGT